MRRRRRKKKEGIAQRTRSTQSAPAGWDGVASMQEKKKERIGLPLFLRLSSWPAHGPVPRRPVNLASPSPGAVGADALLEDRARLLEDRARLRQDRASLHEDRASLHEGIRRAAD